MSTLLKVMDMQPDYRPDEKFLKFGGESLTCAELLAIILRTGSCGEPSIELTRKILYNASSGLEDVQNIFSYDLHTLQKMKGVGKVKSLQIKAVAELSKRLSTSRMQSVVLREPKVIAQRYMEQLRYRKREAVILLMLNSSCRLIRDICLFEGTVNMSLFSPREIFLEALKYEAVNVVLLHNHPGGLPVPSEADIHGTRQVRDAGKILGIHVLDHIIIGDGEYLSLREKGFFDE